MKFVDDSQVPYDAEHCNPIIPTIDQFEKAIEALNNMLITIVEQLAPTMQRMIESLAPIVSNMQKVIKTYPNKRVVYLAIHGKERVRKKNIKRIMKWLEREKTDGT